MRWDFMSVFTRGRSLIPVPTTPIFGTETPQMASGAPRRTWPVVPIRFYAAEDRQVNIGERGDAPLNCYITVELPNIK